MSVVVGLPWIVEGLVYAASAAWVWRGAAKVPEIFALAGVPGVGLDVSRTKLGMSNDVRLGLGAVHLGVRICGSQRFGRISNRWRP